MEYFSRLLGTRASRSADAASTTSSSASSSGGVTSSRSGFLRAVAGIGDSESSAAAAANAAARNRRSGGSLAGGAGAGTSKGGRLGSSALSSSRARKGKGGKGAVGSDDLASSFIADWEAVKSTLTSPDQRALHYGIVRSDVPLLLERMVDALILESTSFATLGPQESTTDIPPCMEYLLRSSLLDILVQLSLPNKPKGSLALAIQFFTQLIVALDESFVSRQAVHRPLARLIRGCVGDEDGDDLERLRSLGLDVGDEDDLLGSDDDDDGDGDEGDDDDDARAAARRRRRTRSRYGRINSVEAASFEQDLVDLMAHIAARIKSSPELLLIFFHDRCKSSHHQHQQQPAIAASPSSSAASASPQLTFLGPDAKPEFPLFSYLLRFIHREGSIGELARAGLLNLIHVALAPEAMAIPFATAAESSSADRPGSRRDRTVSSSSVFSNGSGAASARQALAAFILDSDFAEVLGAGLGAIYGLLPTKLVLLRPQPASKGDEDGVKPGAEAQAELGGAGGVASMLGSEGMRLGASSSTPLPSLDSDLVDVHFLLEEATVFAGAAELPERLRAAGMATSNDPEVQAQVRLLVLLLDFAQDVLGTAAESIYRDSIVALDAETPTSHSPSPSSSPLFSIAASLSASIVDAIRSIFLQNVVYPSMLECSDVDGSATAVMSYLDVLLSVIDDRSILADVVIGYLVGAEAESEGRHARHGKAPSESTVRGAEEDEDADASESVIRLDGHGAATRSSSNRAGKKLKRRRSLALRMVQEDSRAASNNRWGGVVDGDGELAFAYNASDDAFGRYTLTDLILSHLEESASASGGRRKKRRVSAQARQASLRLLKTVLAEHGRFAMGSLVGCIRDDGATAFPFPKPSMLAPSGSASNAVGMNGNGNAHVEEEPQAWPDEAPAGFRKLDEDLTTRFGGLEDESQPWGDGGFNTRTTEVDLQNGHGSAPNAQSSPAASQVTGIQLATTSLESHLHELALYSYLVGTLRAIDDPKTAGRSLSGIQASSYERYLQDATDLLSYESTYLYGLEEGRDSELPLAPFRHRLSPRTDPLLRTLVKALARFFMHSPESNLLLTGTLAALVRCPYRSLEGWLSPSASRRELANAQQGDEAGLEEQIRSVGSYLSWSPGWITSLSSGGGPKSPLGGQPADADAPIVMFVLIGLAAQVRRYARSIPEFGTYLRERREGLMFVENLNDALGLGGIGVEDEDGTLGFGDSSGSTPSTPTASSQTLKAAGGKSLGTAVVPPSKVPPALTSALQRDGGEDSAGLPAVLYYKTAPPEDAGRPGTTTLPSSAAAAAKTRPGRGKGANRRGNSTPGSGTDSPSTGGNGIMVQPFARHYAETGAIFVGTAAVRLPAHWRTSGEDAEGDGEGGARRRIRFEDDQGPERASVDEDEDEDEEPESESDAGVNAFASGLLTRPKAIRMGSSTASSVTSTSSLGAGGTKGVLKKKKSEVKHVTLSALLDNVVILEQAVMELLAIVQVRRCAGIDAVAISSSGGGGV
ncbi:hypothetical protein V8E36_009556 [Tilletia maclaganii]